MRHTAIFRQKFYLHHPLYQNAYNAGICFFQTNQASGLLTQALADLVARQEEYEQARQRNLATPESGFDLATHGNAPGKREEIHDR